MKQIYNCILQYYKKTMYLMTWANSMFIIAHEKPMNRYTLLSK